MAHVVGVPRRDPCHKCQLPVFLAERLTVGKKVYHRTCLKCARCGSQLTPGSFYETEVDDEYCCETCPDEEEIGDEAASSSAVLRNRTKDDEMGATSIDAGAGGGGGAAANAVNSKAPRSSIAERLAFFEHSKSGGGEATNAADSKLLQKSVSDEEKSLSLKRQEVQAASSSNTTPVASYKMNLALSNFLNETIDGGHNETENEESEPTSTTSDKTENQMETSDTEETEEDVSLEQKVPELPKSLPPAVEAVGKSPSPTKRFTATAQLKLATMNNGPQGSGDDDDQRRPVEVKKEVTGNVVHEVTEKKKTKIQFNLATPEKTSNDTMNNNDTSISKAELAEKPETQKIPDMDVELSQRIDNDNDCITKEKIADTEIAAAAVHAPNADHNVASTLQTDLKGLEAEITTDQEMSNDQSLEMRTKSPKPKPQNEHEHEKSEAGTLALRGEEDLATTERLSVVRARLQQFEVIANNKNNNAASPDKVKTNFSDKEKCNLSDDNSTTNPVSVKSEESPPNSSPLHENSIKPKLLFEANIDDAEKLQKMEMEPETETETMTNDHEKQGKETESVKEMPENRNEVPLLEQPKDNSKVGNKPDTIMETETEAESERKQEAIESAPIDKEPEIDVKQSPSKVSTKLDEYPEDLNPFKSDDEDDEEENKENINRSRPQPNQRITPQPRTTVTTSATKRAEKNDNLNPFDSSDDEIELEKSQNSTASTPASSKVPPPRPPPPRISRNPFGDETPDDEENFSRRSSLSSSLTKKTPVPTPRTNLSQSQSGTPEPTPRLSNKTPQGNSGQVLQNSSDYYGSANSLSTSTSTSITSPQSLHRNSDVRGSNNSLTSSAGGTIRARKTRKAPAPPVPVKELFPSNETIPSSKASTPNSSTVGTPKSSRKKRPAPAPPKPARLETNMVPQIRLEHETNGTAPKNLHSYPLQSESDSKLSDEEKALLEGKQLPDERNSDSYSVSSHRSTQRIIPADASLLGDYDDDDDHGNGGDNDKEGRGKSDDAKQKLQLNFQEEETNVVYRRVLVPPALDTPSHDTNPLLDDLNAHDRQLEKMKDNKEAKNRNRQSQISASSGAEDCDGTSLYNKSSHGKWKRRKGPAPALPVPPRKVLQMLPLQEIRHELEIIEVQQQGLEKQGVILEKMIRDRCEGQNGELLGGGGSGTASKEDTTTDGSKNPAMPENVQNSKEVEDLILQLFELVNEKNELFRRQAELMYLRRQHRLEQEQADLEYEIRVLMAQPERNKTDTDKAREEALIARLVEVVQLRNEVVECLEMDRLREAEEDLSIKQRLEMHTAKRDSDADSKKSSVKLSKKEKKKQKEAKKLSKNKKIDADKDADESELTTEKQKMKKKKKKLFF